MIIDYSFNNIQNVVNDFFNATSVNISNIYADIHDKKFKIIPSWCPEANLPFDPEYHVNRSLTSIIMSTNKDNPIENLSLSNVNFKTVYEDEREALFIKE